MNGSKTSSGHTMTRRTVFSRLLLLSLLLPSLPCHSAKEKTACAYNGKGECSVKPARQSDETMELLGGDGSQSNQTINWKIRPQNIGFMYYLRTADDGDDLSLRGIVRWKVQLKNWSTNDTAVEGFLVSILDHDTNETVVDYELSMSESFADFVEYSEVLEIRLELDDVLGFDKRYDAKINILPLGKQAAASSFLSIMGNFEGEKCSAKTGLAERWAPNVIADVFETTSEIEFYWKLAPSALCIKTYEVVLQNREGYILNTTEIEVTPDQKIANGLFTDIKKGEMVHVKVRGKTSFDGGCACVNCNCITDKTKYFSIDHNAKPRNRTTIPKSNNQKHQEPSGYSGFELFLIIFTMAMSLALIIVVCVVCTKCGSNIFKQKVSFGSLTTPRYPNKKIRVRKAYKVMVVCPEVTGRDHDYIMRIAEALRKSSNTVVFDKWQESSHEAEENVLHWVYDQTRVADKILVFHSTSYRPARGIYELIGEYFPSTDPRLVHIAITEAAQRNFPREVQYIMPRDQKHLEEAFDITVESPLVIDIPSDFDHGVIHHGSCDSLVKGPQKSKTQSTDSGVSSMSSNSSQSGGNVEQVPRENEIPMHEITHVASEDIAGSMESVEALPLLQPQIEVV